MYRFNILHLKDFKRFSVVRDIVIDTSKVSDTKAKQTKQEFIDHIMDLKTLDPVHLELQIVLKSGNEVTVYRNKDLYIIHQHHNNVSTVYAYKHGEVVDITDDLKPFHTSYKMQKNLNTQYNV